MLQFLRLPYDPYFRLQLDTQSLADLLADVFDQLEGLLGRTAPEVYEVVGMHRGDLDPAYPGAFQASGLYHATWEVSLGRLKVEPQLGLLGEPFMRCALNSFMRAFSCVGSPGVSV